MVVTISELARGFGHLSQGRSAVYEQYAIKAEVWREARPEMSAVNLCNPAPTRRTDFTPDYFAVCNT
jgi:hypothetical protein